MHSSSSFSISNEIAKAVNISRTCFHHHLVHILAHEWAMSLAFIYRFIPSSKTNLSSSFFHHFQPANNTRSQLSSCSFIFITHLHKNQKQHIRPLLPTQISSFIILESLLYNTQQNTQKPKPTRSTADSQPFNHLLHAATQPHHKPTHLTQWPTNTITFDL